MAHPSPLAHFPCQKCAAPLTTHPTNWETQPCAHDAATPTPPARVLLRPGLLAAPGSSLLPSKPPFPTHHSSSQPLTCPSAHSAPASGQEAGRNELSRHRTHGPVCQEKAWFTQRNYQSCLFFLPEGPSVDTTLNGPPHCQVQMRCSVSAQGEMRVLRGEIRAQVSCVQSRVFPIFALPSVGRNSEEGPERPGGRPPGFQAAERLSEGAERRAFREAFPPLALATTSDRALESPDIFGAESPGPLSPSSWTTSFPHPCSGPRGGEVAVLPLVYL